jgi:hypothetical protein
MIKLSFVFRPWLHLLENKTEKKFNFSRKIFVKRATDDPYVTGSNLTVGCGCRSFGRDCIIRGPVSQQVWHVKESLLLKATSAKQVSISLNLQPCHQ